MSYKVNGVSINDPINSIDVESRLRNFYKSKDWITIRAEFLEEYKKNNDKFTCKYCNCELCFKTKTVAESENRNKKFLNVDHILPVRYFWDKRLDISNLQLLCEYCNKTKGNSTDEYHINRKIESKRIEERLVKELEQRQIKKEAVRITNPRKEKYIPPKLFHSVTKKRDEVEVTQVNKYGKYYKVYTVKTIK